MLVETLESDDLPLKHAFTADFEEYTTFVRLPTHTESLLFLPFGRKLRT